jgi:NodT family efflux transporter outer membrane factor (OMF) lipoprotein
MNKLIFVKDETDSKNHIHALTSILLLLIIAFFAGCATVGPNYVPPEFNAQNTWHADLKHGLSFEPTDADTLAEWWVRLNDPVLSDLIQIAIRTNLDLEEAQARIREARARRGIIQARLFPTLDSSGSFTQRRSSEATGSGTEIKFYSAGFDAGWEIDIFGGVRRSIEAADADLQGVEENLNHVLVSLLAEVGLNYVEARTFQARISVAQANLQIQEETYDLTRFRFEAGLIDELPVKQALYNLENTRSQLPTLRSGLEATLNRLAVLLGQPPGAVHRKLDVYGEIPVPPLHVAVGVPAETLRFRPDIRRAERALAAQNARIGAAVADLYPRFSLSGSIGLESFSSTNFFNSGNHAWRFGKGIFWNIFDAGAIRQNIQVQSALYEQAFLQYESTVLGALEEVENAMVSYAEEQIRRESLAIATDAAQQASLLSQDRFTAGLVDFSNVLDSQRSLLSFQDQLARSEGDVTANLIRLYKALGGGWKSFSEDNEPRVSQYRQDIQEQVE